MKLALAHAHVDLMVATPMPIEGVEERLRECVNQIKETGALALVVEWDQAYEFKMLLDTAFGGEAHLRNEIIWVTRRAQNGVGGARRFIERHRTILWYVKNPEVAGFEPMKMPKSLKTRARFGDGRIVSTLNPLTKRRAPTRIDGSSMETPLNDVWVYDIDQSAWIYDLDEIDGRGALGKGVLELRSRVEDTVGSASETAMIERLRTLSGVPQGGVVLESFV